MKLVIWVLMAIGITPVMLISIVSCSLAAFGSTATSKGTDAVAHSYISKAFLEVGSLKIALKPSVAPAILICAGSAMIVIGTLCLRIE